MTRYKRDIFYKFCLFFPNSSGVLARYGETDTCTEYMCIAVCVSRLLKTKRKTKNPAVQHGAILSA